MNLEIQEEFRVACLVKSEKTSVTAAYLEIEDATVCLVFCALRDLEPYCQIWGGLPIFKRSGSAAITSITLQGKRSKLRLRARYRCGLSQVRDARSVSPLERQ